MKRAVITLAALLCISLTACTVEGDPLGKYATKVEGYKEQIENGLNELEDELDDLQTKIEGVSKDVSG